MRIFFFFKTVPSFAFDMHLSDSVIENTTFDTISDILKCSIWNVTERCATKISLNGNTHRWIQHSLGTSSTWSWCRIVLMRRFTRAHSLPDLRGTFQLSIAPGITFVLMASMWLVDLSTTWRAYGSVTSLPSSAQHAMRPATDIFKQLDSRFWQISIWQALRWD